MREHSAVAPAAVLDRDEHRPAAQQDTSSATLQLHSTRGWGSLATRLLGAITLILVGVVHLQAYGGPYAAVPTIGTLFLVNFVAATTIGAALLLPLERVTGRRASWAVVLVSLAGIGLAGGSLAMLYISEHGTVFGFHEPGYDPEAISRSRVTEFITAGLLGVSLALRIGPASRPRW
jgi:hypothetical protein